MNPTESKLDEVLADKNDDLTPVEEAPKDDAAESTESTTGSTGSTTTSDDTSASEEGYTANEAKPEESEEKEETQTPSLNSEMKYIVDNLPEVTARIIVDGKPTDVSVKSYTQLPQDVEFASKRDELAFLNAMTNQENRARELQQEFKSKEQQKESNEFEQRENAAIRDDITELQNAGKLPKFKVDANSPGFNDDPGTKEVQKVLDFMNKKNEEYLNRYNNGYAYRHIGFAEAYDMMPETRQQEAQKVAQDQEDKARQQTNRVQPPTGVSNLNIKKATVKQGTTLDDIVAKYDQEL